jgi:hypothetical protein
MSRLRTKEIINSTQDNLLIDEDESGVEDNWFPVVVLTYSPNLKDFLHYHIELSLEQAEILKNWLNKFIEKHEGLKNNVS